MKYRVCNMCNVYEKDFICLIFSVLCAEILKIKINNIISLTQKKCLEQMWKKMYVEFIFDHSCGFLYN
jgi:hypothetical protein